MTHIWDKLLRLTAAAAGAVAGLYGGVDTALRVLVALMAIDYLTGLIVGWLGQSTKTATGRLDSKAGFRGIAKKFLMLLMVLAAALLDRALGTDAAMFRSLMVWFYTANEGLSILENLSLAGVPFPDRIREALEQVMEDGE